MGELSSKMVLSSRSSFCLDFVAVFSSDVVEVDAVEEESGERMQKMNRLFFFFVADCHHDRRAMTRLFIGRRCGAVCHSVHEQRYRDST